MSARWFAPHVAYTIAKYGMSMCVLGMAEEFRGRIAFNALWPHTPIATAAIENRLGPDAMRETRWPEIIADAAHAILIKDAGMFTGNFVLDDKILAANGVKDFARYGMDPSAPLRIDLFVDARRHPLIEN